MDEKNRTSLKLDIVGARSQLGSEGEVAKESYKSIPEESVIKNSLKEPEKDNKMVQNGDPVNDGAEEKMLENEEKERLAKKDEVKFISGDQQNGDAKIDIGNLDKAFTGMTKEELMKYANDPFWVRLRWMFFIIFWAIWVAMLVGAILIIINAPKCAAPSPLAWYKQGPLVEFKSQDASADDLVKAKKVSARGVIYELPPEDTYSVKEPAVEAKIKNLVQQYKDTDIKVILDLTANYVFNGSSIFDEALTEANREALFWVSGPELPNNWQSIVNGSAWNKTQDGNYVLSQFGTGKYDLIMNSTLVKNRLKDSLRHLITLGVKGFRLANAKYFIINKNLGNEEVSSDPHYIHDQYGFWTHKQTTFQEGLGDLLHEFTLFVRNVSDGDAFLSVSEDTVRPEVFKTNFGSFGVDIPIYGRLSHSLGLKTKTGDLYNDLKSSMDIVGNSTWLQWVYDFDSSSPIEPSAYNMFLMLLPGVPVLPGDSPVFNISNESTIISQLEALRLTPSYMHGSFDLYHHGDVVAYSRIKSGNPGYLVVLNPSGVEVQANFTSVGLPEKMTFDLFSNNYNVTGIEPKAKVKSDAIIMSPYSAALLTYVPVKSG